MCISTLLDSDSRIDDVIVVDDHSQDATKLIVEGLHDPRVRFFEKPPGYVRGKNDSIYLGAMLARNEDLIMLDADTKVKSVSHMIDLLQGGADLVGGIIDVIAEDGKFISRCEALEYDVSIRRARPWLFRNFGYLNNVSGAFFGIKQKRLLENRIPNNVVGEDFYLTQIGIIQKWKIALSESHLQTYATPGFRALFIQRCRWVNGFYTIMRETGRYTPLIEMTTIYYRSMVTAIGLLFGLGLTAHFWILTFSVLLLYFLNEYRFTRSFRKSLEMMAYRQINFAAALLFFKYGRTWRVIR